MDVPMGVTGFFATIQRLWSRDPQSIKADSVDDLIRKRFGAGLTDKQVRNVLSQGWVHLTRIRNEARTNNLEPNFYIADALLHADFKPILNEAEYEKRKALYDRVFVQTIMGR